MWRVMAGGAAAACVALAGTVLTTTATTAAASPIVVTRDDGSMPARCDARKSAKAVAAFFDGFGAGGLTKEVERYAPEPVFGWYSMSGWAHKAVYRPAALRRYLKERRAVRERLRLRMLLVSYDPARGLVNFEPRFTRMARDQPAGFDANGSGKGAMRCRDLRLVVLSLAHGPRVPPVADPCPAPEAGTAPADAVIVCTRRPRAA